MSETADPFCRALVRYLTDQLGKEVVFVDNLPWLARLERLLAGEIHAGWVCGWVYVRWKAHLELLAAPVMAAARYAGQPVYFSDVIVRRDNAYARLEALRAARWVYNEAGSFSGYLAMLHRLEQMNETLEFFSEAIPSGAHTASLRMVLEGQADLTALDSTAFDQMQRDSPSLADRLHVVESLGPFPVPPWVVSPSLAIGERDTLKQVLWAMHATPRGQAVLSEGLFDRFVSVSDSAYDPIRRMVAGLACGA